MSKQFCRMLIVFLVIISCDETENRIFLGFFEWRNSQFVSTVQTNESLNTFLEAKSLHQSLTHNSDFS